jgi:DNA-binding NarL/FixJ family response regulator
MTRILIADSNPPARSACTLLLSYKLGFSDISEVGDVDAFFRALAEYPPDILLLDWQLFGAPSPDLCRLLRIAYPTMKIALLSINPEDNQPAQDAGAIFIQKGSSPDAVLTALKFIQKIG